MGETIYGVNASRHNDSGLDDPANQNKSVSGTTSVIDRANYNSNAVSTGWHGTYRMMLIGTDALAICLALAVSLLARSRFSSLPMDATATITLTTVVAVAWGLSLVACDAYEVRRVCTGPEEWQRLVRATLLSFAVVVVACYFTKQDMARGFLLIAFPVGLFLLALGRLHVRRLVRARRVASDWRHRVLAVGSSRSVDYLVSASAKARHAGMVVVGACVDDVEVGTRIHGDIPVVGTIDEVSDHAERLGADVVALTGSHLGPVRVRELSWQLEGSGRSLVMAHAVSNVAAPRLHVSPLEGMPMVWVDQPQFSGVTRWVKRAFDVLAASVGLLLLAPTLAVVAALIKLTSPGPVFFRQSRLGLDGREFFVLKLRTMVDGAEAMRADLVETNELDGALFKMQADPRITFIGRWLRRLSVDELPQLWNVVRGDMSLVGPRPLATIDSNYHGPARRRLLVRPGITGLWQVSGRSDLAWEEAVQLDLYYVENWSFGLDLGLIVKTASAVFTRRGAY